MVGLVALNLVLRVIRAGVMNVALVGHILGVHPHNPAGDPACLGIPANMIADLEHSSHDGALFDHIGGNREQRWRHVEAESSCRPEVDAQFEPGRKLHRQVARLLAFEDAINIASHPWV